MEVILLERVRNLGDLGDNVNVKSGYARNHLVPYGKAVVATKANKEHFETRRAELEKAAADKLAAATKRSEDFADLVLTITRKASDEGKLYGSITVQDIVDVIKEKKINIEKNEVNMPEGPMRSVGEYAVEVQLHSDLVSTVKVEIVAE